MVGFLQVSKDLTFTLHDMDQRLAYTVLGGALRFVGHVEELNAVVCATDGRGDPWPDGVFWEGEVVRGDVLVLGSDEDGEEIGLGVDRAQEEMRRRMARALAPN